MDTNNGVEALNKVLKYGYLPKKNSLTLSGIATLLVKNYLPDMYQKYIFQNYKFSGEYRAYSPSVPSYLHGRPHSIITHCLHRKAKANKYTTEDVTKVDDGVFQVTKPKGGNHTVTFCSDSGSPSCTCKDGSDIIYLASTFSACLIFTLIIGIGLHFLNVTWKVHIFPGMRVH